MVGIDTNILVRYITQDGDETEAANRFLENECSELNPGFLSLMVLCELVWVLRRAYKFEKMDICTILEKIFTTREFNIENSMIAWRALKLFKNSNADFSDHVIGENNSLHGVSTTMTLDKKAAKTANFTLLEIY